MNRQINCQKLLRRGSPCLVLLCVLWGARPLFAGAADVTETVIKANPDKWEFTLSMSGGYDSNPTNLGDGLALPPELEQRGSGFIEAEGFAKFTHDFAKQRGDSGTTDQFKLSYDFIADIYTDISGNDQNSHTVLASYKRSLCSSITGELRLMDMFVQSDGNALFNLFQVRPTLLFDESKISKLLKRLELAYAFSTYKFFPTGASIHDQDRHSIIVDQAFALSENYGTQFDFSYIHVWNSARGADYDFRENSLVVELQTNFAPEPLDGQPEPLLHKLSMDVKFKYNFDRYSNLNSNAAFLRRRSDDYSQVIAVLAFTVNKHVTLTASYTYGADRSNIPVYRYDEHTVLCGMSVNF